MTAIRTNSNGQERKTLASQLDRLDGILDGLDTALTDAVQEAVELAVKQAVQAVLTEVLTNRELKEQLQQAAPTHAPDVDPGQSGQHGHCQKSLRPKTEFSPGRQTDRLLER